MFARKAQNHVADKLFGHASSNAFVCILEQSLSLGQGGWEERQRCIINAFYSDMPWPLSTFVDLAAYQWARPYWQDLFWEQRCPRLPEDRALQQQALGICNEARLTPIVDNLWGSDSLKQCLQNRSAFLYAGDGATVFGVCACLSKSDRDVLGLSFLMLTNPDSKLSYRFVPDPPDPQSANLYFSRVAFLCRGKQTIFNRLVSVETCPSDPCQDMSEWHQEILAVEVPDPRGPYKMHANEFLFFWPLAAKN